MTVSSPPLVLSGNHQLGSEVSRGGGGGQFPFLLSLLSGTGREGLEGRLGNFHIGFILSKCSEISFNQGRNLS